MEPPPGSERQKADQQLEAILQRSAQKQKKSSVRTVLTTIVVILLLGAGGVYALFRFGIIGGSDGGELPGLLTTEAPWPANGEQLGERLDEIGLPRLTQETGPLHLHSTLEIRINGEGITVPANIGIDPALTFLSPLHTHDELGTIHVEAAEVRDYTLGEFFDVWGVRLTSECIGGHCGPGLRVRVDGQLVDDPRSIVLADPQRIAITFEG